jgi:hypothetical protein
MPFASRSAWACALALGALLAPAGGAAPARDPDLPEVDPPGQGRAVAGDDATTASRCVGNPVTPLCAVETVIACFTRKQDELCRIGMGLDRPPELVRDGPVPDDYYYYRYRVVSARRFGANDLPEPRELKLTEMPPAWWYTEDRRQYRPGDAEIVLLQQICWPSPAGCDPMGDPDRFTYHLRRLGENWAVLVWDTPDPRFEEVKPEEF